MQLVPCPPSVEGNREFLILNGALLFFNISVREDKCMTEDKSKN